MWSKEGQNFQPFDEKPLDGAFYHPTRAKELSFEDKKQCLSPVIKLHPNSDANMLQIDSLQTLSNALQPDLVPTKDTAMHTSSASSEFEETWPSTDLTGSTKMQSPIQFNHKSKEDEMPGNAIAESNESKSTIARYIQRFRSEPPKPREERTGMFGTAADEFWWAKEPSRSSTPKDSDSSSFSPPVRLRDTWKRSQKSSRKPPKSPDKKPVMSGAEIVRHKRKVVGEKQYDKLSSDIDGMQQRAQNLILLSENTLTSSSSDVPVQNRLSLEKDYLPTAFAYQPKNVTGNSQIIQKQKSHQEDDILYQWRLARKMEKARQESSAVSQMPYMHEKRIDADLKCEEEIFQDESAIGKPKRQEMRHELMRSIDTQIGDFNRVLTTQKEDSNPAVCYRSVEVQTMSSNIHPLIGRVRVDCNNVASHMHTVCDILPCPHDNHSENNVPNEQVKCRRQDNMPRTSSCDRPVEMAAPVKSLHSSVGSPESTEDKRADCDPRESATVNSDVEEVSCDTNNSRAKHLAEPRIENFDTNREECNRIRQEKEDEHLHKENIKFENGGLGFEKDLNCACDSILRGTSTEKGTASTKITKAIDEVISENLFAASLSHNSSMHSEKSNDIKDDNTEGARESCDLCPVIGYESSDGEFSDDDILKVLRIRRKRYLQILSEIHIALKEIPSGKE